MPQYQTLEVQDTAGVRTLWLNRPEVRNALDDTLIAELGAALVDASSAEGVRVIVLAGRGKAFCSGGDLGWMKRAREMSPDEARRDSGHLARVLRALYESPRPTVARVHGSAFAGAMGLVAACDIAVATVDTRFCLSEVKLGLIPAMISPYVIRAIGERQARRLMLTAELFDGSRALALGLVHEACAPERLEEVTAGIVEHLLAAGPYALTQSKRLIRDVAGEPIGDALDTETAARISMMRAGDEAQEGIAAFFEKRRPAWSTGSRS